MTRSARNWLLVGMLLALPVLVAIWWFVVPNWHARGITSVVGSSESTALEVTVAHEDCGTGDPRVNVDEGPDVVALTAEYDEGRRGCNDEGRLTTVVVDLEEPVGNRTIEVRTLGRGVECDIAGDDLRRCVER